MEVHETSQKYMDAKLRILSRPDGSSMLCQGGTTIMAGVYGPVEAKSQKILIDKASVEAYYRPKSGIASVGDRFYETVITNICEAALVSALYPRSSVVVVIQEMQNGGELVSCAINAACLALLDSGIDMKFLVAAVSCLLDEDHIFHVEPITVNPVKCRATFTFAFDSVEKQVIASHTTGSFSSEDYARALELCRTQSDQVFEFLKKTIRGTVKVKVDK